MAGKTNGRIFGTTTVGERGQVVIPAQIRKNFKIKSGDRLVVMGKEHMFSFVRADDFDRFINEASQAMSKLKNKNPIA